MKQQTADVPKFRITGFDLWLGTVMGRLWIDGNIGLVQEHAIDIHA